MEKGYRRTENRSVLEAKRLEKLRKIRRTPETEDTRGNKKRVEEEDPATSGAITVARWATSLRIAQRKHFTAAVEKIT